MSTTDPVAEPLIHGDGIDAAPPVGGAKRRTVPLSGRPLQSPYSPRFGALLFAPPRMQVESNCPPPGFAPLRAFPRSPMRVPEILLSLTDQGGIDEVLRPLKSGKEALVYLVSADGEPRVAKVYKDAQLLEHPNCVDLVVMSILSETKNGF